MRSHASLPNRDRIAVLSLPAQNVTLSPLVPSYGDGVRSRRKRRNWVQRAARLRRRRRGEEGERPKPLPLFETRSGSLVDDEVAAAEDLFDGLRAAPVA